MPSRKKSRGRERKARNKSTSGSSIQAKSAECRHGVPAELPQSCADFIDTFHNALFRVCDQELTPLKAVMLAMDMTRVKHNAVWLDPIKRGIVRQCFLKLGTDQVLKEKDNHSDLAAALAVGILRLEDEDNASTSLSILDSPKGRAKIRDMILSSSQSAVKFFSKRCPCKCLEKLAKEVKTQAKVGQCIHCDNEKECSAMFLCGNCLIHQYCSKKCQRDAWAEHKPICKQLCKRFNRHDKKQDEKKCEGWNAARECGFWGKSTS